MNSSYAILNARIFDGNSLLDSHHLRVENGIIQDLAPQDQYIESKEKTYDLQGKILAPGLIDLQVNGAGGVLFNDSPTREGIQKIADTQEALGTTKILPTIISDSFSVIERAIEAINKSMDLDKRILGLHLEGPFLNLQKRGVHEESRIQSFTPTFFELIDRLHPKAKLLITLAPEKVPPTDIERLAKRPNLTLSMGHSLASYEECKEAIHRGAKAFTHLFNAMSPLTAREPGVLGAALENDSSWCGFICDMHHVCEASLKIALKCKPQGKLFFVSDSMPSLGSSESDFSLFQQKIQVRGGMCVNENGTLAGAHISLFQSIVNAQAHLGLSLEECLRMASLYPAQLLGVDHFLGRIQKNFHADFLVFDSHGKLYHGNNSPFLF